MSGVDFVRVEADNQFWVLYKNYLDIKGPGGRRAHRPRWPGTMVIWYDPGPTMLDGRMRLGRVVAVLDDTGVVDMLWGPWVEDKEEATVSLNFCSR
jgi:hypothetical protein